MEDTARPNGQAPVCFLAGIERWTADIAPGPDQARYARGDERSQSCPSCKLMSVFKIAQVF